MSSLDFKMDAFFEGFAKYLEKRQDALHASLAWSDIERWLSFEAGAYIHANRADLGIGGEHMENGANVPHWWISREVDRVDLWIEQQYRDEKALISAEERTVYAIELKVCSNYNPKWKLALNELWYQISPEDQARSYSNATPKKYYGLILAYYLNFAAGFGPEGKKIKKEREEWTKIEKDAYFRYICGKDKNYKNQYEDEFWKNLQPESKEQELGIQIINFNACAKLGQYLDPKIPSEARLILIEGKSSV